MKSIPYSLAFHRLRKCQYRRSVRTHNSAKVATVHSRLSWRRSVFNFGTTKNCYFHMGRTVSRLSLSASCARTKRPVAFVSHSLQETSQSRGSSFQAFFSFHIQLFERNQTLNTKKFASFNASGSDGLAACILHKRNFQSPFNLRSFRTFIYCSEGSEFFIHLWWIVLYAVIN